MGNKSLNAFSMLLVAIYFIAIAYHSNGDEFITFISKQTAFIKWIIAFFILLILYDQTKSDLIKGLIFVAFVAMLLNASNGNYLTNIESSIKTYLG